MPQRLLILTDAFLPPMQGTRMRNLAHNLQKAGWHCEMVCEATDLSVFPDDVVVHSFYYYPPKAGKFQRTILLAEDKIFSKKEKQYEQFVKQNVDVESFDVILSSSYLFPMRSVYKIATEFRKPLIVDLRDIVEQWDSIDFMQHHAKGIISKTLVKKYLNGVTAWRNKCLAYAKAVVSVSPWHVEQLKRYNANTYLIYNGFDNKTFTPERVRTTTFNITYAGSIYNLLLRNPQILFEAVALLRHQELIGNDVRLQFYVEEHIKAQLTDLARQTGIEQLLELHGFVKNNDIPRILSQSSVVLILNNSSSNRLHGILPTKLFEAIGAETPVLCLPVRNDDMQLLIAEQHCGLATDNVEQTAEFLLEQYRYWQENGYTHLCAADKQIFSRQNQAKQYDELLREVIRKQGVGNR